MGMKYEDVGGSFEAGYDGQSCVVLRLKDSTGLNYHLTRQVVHELLGLFPAERKGSEALAERCPYGGPDTPSSCRLPKGHEGLHERHQGR